MNTFEDHLRHALRREDPPEGFEARVLARVQRAPRRSPARPWLMAASLLALLLPMGWMYHRQTERRREAAEAERAQAELLLALQITSQKLNLALHRIQSPSETP